MNNYYFYMPHVPRTTTRAEWYKAWRDVRIGQHTSAALEKGRFDLLRNQNIPAKVRKDLMDNLINPPIVLGPFMDRQFDPTLDIIR